MPHSKRPRRNRVNKIRAKKGLPPLGELPDLIPRTVVPEGITALWIPLPTPVRTLLHEVRVEVQRRDPATVPSDEIFASAFLTADIIRAHEILFPKLIQAPGSIVAPDAPLPEGAGQFIQSIRK